MLLFTYLSLHCCDKYLDCLQWSLCAICFLLLQPPWFIWKIIDTFKRYDAMTCRIHLFFFVSCWRQQDVSFAACHTFASVQQEGYRRLFLGEKGATAWRWTVPSHNVEVKNEWSCTSYFPLYLHVLHKDKFTFTFYLNRNPTRLPTSWLKHRAGSMGHGWNSISVMSSGSERVGGGGDRNHDIT